MEETVETSVIAVVRRRGDGERHRSGRGDLGVQSPPCRRFDLRAREGPRLDPEESRASREGRTAPEAQAEGALSRISTTTDAVEAVREAQAVIEAVPEDLTLKLEIFRRLDGAAPGSALLLSNTSELSIAALASATNRRDRVAGMHWFNPPPLMKLIEIVRAEETSDETVAAVEELSRRMGKETVVCRDARGFITSPGARGARPGVLPDRRGGDRHAEGHRHGHPPRPQLPDGPVRARGLRRARHPRRRRARTGRGARAALCAATPSPRASREGTPGRQDGEGLLRPWLRRFSFPTRARLSESSAARCATFPGWSWALLRSRAPSRAQVSTRWRWTKSSEAAAHRPRPASSRPSSRGARC